MTRTGAWCWAGAVVITLASAVYQRISGPTYPARGAVRLGAQEIRLRLERSHGGAGGQPVRVRAVDPAIRGEVVWRRAPSSEPWQTLVMRRDGEWLMAILPHQPPAGKLEYQVLLERDGERDVFPPSPALTRFKGDVAAVILVPHIVAMFLGMLVSNRAGLEAATGGPLQRRFAYLALGLLVVGGFIFGPAVQKAAFGEWWTGIPFGWDLTDNKTLVAGLAWLWATWRLRRGRESRGSLVAAAVITLAIFAIPHSVWGSEIRWEAVPPGP